MSSDAIELLLPHLPIFQGFPYLSVSVAPALYHIEVLPAGHSVEALQDIARRQATLNNLPCSLVLASNDSFYYAANGQGSASKHPPHGGMIAYEKLQPICAWNPTEDLLLRRTRLVQYAKLCNAGHDYVLGDPTKGGRKATAQELRVLAGQHCGLPRGLERCSACGEFRGRCLDPNPEFEGIIMPVHCWCENCNLCARCLRLLSRWKLNGNRYDAGDGQIWHNPGFVAFSHYCHPKACATRAQS